MFGTSWLSKNIPRDSVSNPTPLPTSHVQPMVSPMAMPNSSFINYMP